MSGEAARSQCWRARRHWNPVQACTTLANAPAAQHLQRLLTQPQSCRSPEGRHGGALLPRLNKLLLQALPPQRRQADTGSQARRQLDCCAAGAAPTRVGRVALPVEQAPAMHMCYAAGAVAGAIKQRVLSRACLPTDAAVGGLGWRRH